MMLQLCIFSLMLERLLVSVSNIGALQELSWTYPHHDRLVLALLTSMQLHNFPHFDQNIQTSNSFFQDLSPKNHIRHRKHSIQVWLAMKRSRSFWVPILFNRYRYHYH